jgi:serine O-acetyltransferase
MTMFEHRFDTFRQDAARWVVQGQVADPSTLSTADILKLLYRYMSLRATAWFRFGGWCKQHRLPLLPGFVQRRILRVYGLEISPGMDVGGGLYIAHPVGTAIYARHIGRNCSIIATVTIGMRNKWEFPAIGDDVFIGAGARVLGGIEVGDGARIGANAVVIHDVPSYSTAVGIPAQVVNKEATHAPVERIDAIPTS